MKFKAGDLVVLVDSERRYGTDYSRTVLVNKYDPQNDCYALTPIPDMQNVVGWRMSSSIADVKYRHLTISEEKMVRLLYEV